MNEKIKNLAEDNEELREKYVGIESELEDLKSHIIQEHINNFNKGLRHAAFFCKELDVVDPSTMLRRMSSMAVWWMKMT